MLIIHTLASVGIQTQVLPITSQGHKKLQLKAVLVEYFKQIMMLIKS